MEEDNLFAELIEEPTLSPEQKYNYYASKALDHSGVFLSIDVAKLALLAGETVHGTALILKLGDPNTKNISEAVGSAKRWRLSIIWFQTLKKMYAQKGQPTPKWKTNRIC